MKKQDEKVFAYCQYAPCQKHFKREKGEVLGAFIVCSKECEKKLVQRNLEFLLTLWEEKYYVPTPPQVFNNQVSFPVI